MSTEIAQSRTGYVRVNGVEMYYEIHGTGRPLVLLHGALSATGTSFGAVLPGLAASRQVISFELQAHGHTADIDRPLRLEYLADDVAAGLQQLGIEQADFFGYSVGAGVALQVAIRHPEVVRKLVLASVSYTLDGLHPGLLEGISQLKPEYLVGTPWQVEYARIAPRPEDFPRMVERVKEMDLAIKDVPAEDVRSIKAPVLLIIGDSDIVRPEHAVEMFRMFGGGVSGDAVGMPNSQLAILPGASHVTVVSKADMLMAMIPPFLDAPPSEERSRD